MHEKPPNGLPGPLPGRANCQPPGRTPGQARPAARPGCSCRGPGCPRGVKGTTSILWPLRWLASPRSPCGGSRVGT